VDVGVRCELMRVARTPYGLEILERGVGGDVEDIAAATARESAMDRIEGDDVESLRQPHHRLNARAHPRAASRAQGTPLGRV
jgi:hypothetical protein